MKVKVSNVNQPAWKECNIHATLPAELSKLQELAYNVWWSWNGEAKDLFRYIDTEAWHRANSNPVVLMNILKKETNGNVEIVIKKSILQKSSRYFMFQNY